MMLIYTLMTLPIKLTIIIIIIIIIITIIMIIIITIIIIIIIIIIIFLRNSYKITQVFLSAKNYSVVSIKR